MPTRRINASPVKVTGTVPDDQKFESFLEEDFFTLLRFNRLVAAFEHQPVTLEWFDEAGRIRDYTPDVLVHYRTELPEAAGMIPMLCEVKPDFAEDKRYSRRRGPPRKEDEAENALRWAAAERYATRRGWGFKVYRESEIRTPLLDNARFLLRHHERLAPSNADSALLDILRTRGSMALGEWVGSIASGVEQRALLLPACYRLVGAGEVEADLSAQLSLQTEVRIPSYG